MRVGVPEKHGSCYLLRHTTATLMLDAGADVRYIAEMVGHRKLETTMGYTRVPVAELQGGPREVSPGRTTYKDEGFMRLRWAPRTGQRARHQRRL